MCVYRDIKYCLILTVLFELSEVSLQHVIPEFTECWWDSIFMDTLGANLIGIGLGWATLKYLDSRHYDWVAYVLYRLLFLSWSMVRLGVVFLTGCSRHGCRFDAGTSPRTCVAESPEFCGSLPHFRGQSVRIPFDCIFLYAVVQHSLLLRFGLAKQTPGTSSPRFHGSVVCVATLALMLRVISWRSDSCNLFSRLQMSGHFLPFLHNHVRGECILTLSCPQHSRRVAAEQGAMLERRSLLVGGNVPMANCGLQARLVLLLLLAVPAISEFYAYMTRPHYKRIGQNTWLVVCIGLVECLLIVKFGRDRLHWTPPFDVAVCWGLFFLLLSLWCLGHFWYCRPAPVMVSQEVTRQHIHSIYWSAYLDVVLILAVLCLLPLFRRWTWQWPW